jgi:hypothetical protein
VLIFINERTASSSKADIVSSLLCCMDVARFCVMSKSGRVALKGGSAGSVGSFHKRRLAARCALPVQKVLLGRRPGVRCLRAVKKEGDVLRSWSNSADSPAFELECEDVGDTGACTELSAEAAAGREYWRLSLLSSIALTRYAKVNVVLGLCDERTGLVAMSRLGTGVRLGPMPSSSTLRLDRWSRQ